MNLAEEIVKLHDIARKIEQEIGFGQLSKTIRDAADKLNEILNETL